MTAIARYAIPMPLHAVSKEVQSWPRLGYVFVAPADRLEYSEEEGGKWSKE